MIKILIVVAAVLLLTIMFFALQMSSYYKDDVSSTKFGCCCAIIFLVYFIIKPKDSTYFQLVVMTTMTIPLYLKYKIHKENYLLVSEESFKDVKKIGIEEEMVNNHKFIVKLCKIMTNHNAIFLILIDGIYLGIITFIDINTKISMASILYFTLWILKALSILFMVKMFYYSKAINIQIHKKRKKEENTRNSKYNIKRAENEISKEYRVLQERVEKRIREELPKIIVSDYNEYAKIEKNEQDNNYLIVNSKPYYCSLNKKNELLKPFYDENGYMDLCNNIVNFYNGSNNKFQLGQCMKQIHNECSIIHDIINYVNLNYSTSKLGILGEKRVNKCVSQYNDITNLENIRLTDKNGNSIECDNILISDYGIFILEVKNYGENGSFRIDIDNTGRWTKSFGRNVEVMDSPVYQNSRHISVLHNILEENNIDVSISGFVVIANDNVDIQNFSTDTVVRPSAIYSTINKGTKYVSKENQEKVKEILVGMKEKDKSYPSWNVEDIKGIVDVFRDKCKNIIAIQEQEIQKYKKDICEKCNVDVDVLDSGLF